MLSFDLIRTTLLLYQKLWRDGEVRRTLSVANWELELARWQQFYKLPFQLARGDGLDFEAGTLGDSGDLDAGAGGERRMEGAGVGVFHGGEVREVGEEHGRGMSLRNV